MLPLANALAQAAKFQQTGKLAEAEQLYREILKYDHQQPDALFRLALITRNDKRFEESIALWHRVTNLVPNQGELWQHYAYTLHIAGKLEQAIPAYRRVVQLMPHAWQQVRQLAAVLHEVGRWPEACEVYEQAIKHQPHDAEFRNNYGVVLQQLGRPEEALRQYRDAVRLKPDYQDALFNLGLLLMEQRAWRESESTFRALLQKQPQHAKAWMNLGNVLTETNRLSESVECYLTALRIDPAYSKAMNNLASALHLQGKHEEALNYFQQSLRIDPHSHEVLSNVGALLFTLARYAEAEQYIQRALQIDPHSHEVLNNVGVLLFAQGRYAEAQQHIERALELDPEYADAHYNLSHVHLLRGDYAQGWPEYDWYSPTQKKTSLAFRWERWTGEPLSQETLLIFAEQGIGDEIMFASCVPEIMPRAHRVILACDPRLIPLFERSFPNTHCVSSKLPANDPAWQALAPIHFQCRAGSIPRYTRHAITDFPSRKQHLCADSERTQYWSQRLSELGNRLNVGISWRGGLEAFAKQRRSTSLALWSQLLHEPEVGFVNLQYGNVVADLAEAQANHGVNVVQFAEIDPLKNMDDFAALISALDLVISIDNSTVHLAGALGVPTWVALPQVPDWRWLLDREDSPWYPSLRLFRQTQLNRWEDVFERIHAALRQLLRERVT